jgi:hypothetical protein
MIRRGEDTRADPERDLVAGGDASVSAVEVQGCDITMVDDSSWWRVGKQPIVADLPCRDLAILMEPQDSPNIDPLFHFSSSCETGIEEVQRSFVISKSPFSEAFFIPSIILWSRRFSNTHLAHRDPVLSIFVAHAKAVSISEHFSSLSIF